MTPDAGAPRVSVVMAVHNGDRYIGAAVDSVLAQRFPDLELIVVDDGSTDRSAAIVRERADPRVRLVSNGRNLGLAPSLNIGVAAARGEFIARLDSDDLALPARLERQVAFMDANPGVALVGSWYVTMAEDGTPGAPIRLPTRHWDLRWHLCIHCPFAHSAVLWRRRVVAERVGVYDERLRFSEDYDFWCRISAQLQVANLPEYLIHLRTHPGSMTSTYGDLTRQGLRMQAAHAGRLLGWPPDEEERNETRLTRLYWMAVSRPRGLTQPELLDAAAEVLRLHAAFVADERVPRAEAERQRGALRMRLARQLLWASRTAVADGRRGASGALLRSVLELAPTALLSRQAVDAGIGIAARVLGWP
jgi:hypothetical protein